MNDSTIGTETYEAFWERFQESAKYHPANRFRYALICEMFNRYGSPRMEVLDIGCGDGNLLNRLSAKLPDVRYYGCDLSHQVIESNRRRNPALGFFQADVAAPDLVARAQAQGVVACDLIVCSELIEHVENDRAVLKNIGALLKPGGHLILTTQSGPRYRIDRELLHHLRHYKRAELEAIVRDAGLAITLSYNCGFPVLTLQKFLADVMFGTVMRAAASSRKPPFLARLVMSMMYYCMLYSPRIAGPQLVIVARKPVL